jgi:hypothetical protein
MKDATKQERELVWFPYRDETGSPGREEGWSLGRVMNDK